ncbi:MAG: MFS transporter [Acidobacteria bacterium]|jgi:OPA family glycerol-3-phosphate transporter-like MFS transporter|nr:MFS transporter [Acidobacteriota bacterium]
MMDTSIRHTQAFRLRRSLNWFPMGITYALLYMGRYNLTVAKNALGDLMTKEEFGMIFGVGAVIYAVSFLINGPLVDRIGGKKGILIAAFGAGAMNLCMGLYLQYVSNLSNPLHAPLSLVFTILYAFNMYFQSYGAVSIVKVNAHWFHVRERGVFSGIFGIMIASGIFLAFDVTQRILDSSLVKGKGVGGGNALWWAFLAPAFLLITFFVIEIFLLRDTPGKAGLQDFDTGDESSGENLEERIPTMQLFKRILTHPVILTIAGIEFCTGVLRNGVMHWYPIYAQEQLDAGLIAGWKYTKDNWGLILWIAGIIGGMSAGYISDKIFQSRRGPSAGLFYGVMSICILGMFFSLSNGWILAGLIFIMSICVIGTHGMLSGTATMDFGGRKGAGTAVGVIDGFVYLGTGVQSFALGILTTKNWNFWPMFLLPFSIIGFILLLFIWHALPGKKGVH